jgi:hypothetical protein
MGKGVELQGDWGADRANPEGDACGRAGRDSIGSQHRMRASSDPDFPVSEALIITGGVGRPASSHAFHASRS